ncbi:hypothetical protein WICPIJ_002158 [Wickerhamomyces pijperi]|uniref:Uncharacterized protein n=1 Tax=Wickerhamomyces pijperi TaxID=599730 RepID=A0A9P8QA77_WICPI|nr:hypothetical protein WICPIJ_002158 [Wickerhamomyces pijperi]
MILPRFEYYPWSIREKLMENNVLSNYLLHFKAAGELFVSFDSLYDPYESFDVQYGNYLEVWHTKLEPSFLFQSFFPIEQSFLNNYFTLVLTSLDPDFERSLDVWINLSIMPQDVKLSDPADFETEFKNKQGIHGTRQTFNATFDFKSGVNLVPYKQPKPQKGSGDNRFVFLLFRQPSGALPIERLKFRDRWGSKYNDHGVVDWADYYGLEPIAVNFFNSSYDKEDWF